MLNIITPIAALTHTFTEAHMAPVTTTLRGMENHHMGTGLHSHSWAAVIRLYYCHPNHQQ